MAYNGWKNYETWNVALWIDNEPGTYGMRCEWAQQSYNDAAADQRLSRKERAAISLSETIKDWVEDNSPLAGVASMYSDLLGAAISEVDWHEIATNWLEDVTEDEPANQ